MRLPPAALCAAVATAVTAALLPPTAALAAPPEAPAAVPGFSTSFEAADTPPTWTDTVDTGADGEPRAAGVDGGADPGIAGSVADRVTAIAANAEPNANEGKENLNDADPTTKWLVDTPASWAQYTLREPVTVVRYALTSANDAPSRDPKDWTLRGSTDGTTWVDVDRQTGQAFTERFQLRTFDVATPGAYRYYRLDITAHGSGDLTQLADWQLSDGGTSQPAGSMRSRAGSGPGSAPAAKARVGYTGLAAFQVSGRQTADGRAYSYNRVFETNLTVTADTELSYLVFPEFTTGDLSYPATHVAVDLAFSDGTFLSGLKAVDQHGTVVSPAAQGAAKKLSAQQWNRVRARIGGVAKGKTVTRVLVGYERTGAPTTFRAWFDDLAITATAPEKPKASLADYVETRRGTHSSGGFSRGNNFPATAVPHGFNFWTPVTDAGTTGWLYEWHRRNNAQNRPRLEAFAASHQPSPWMGDRQTFQVMPGAGGAPVANRAERALPFSHDNETATAHYYGVTFDNGIRTEIAPTDHAALFRFTFTGDSGNLVFDNVDANAGLSVDAANGVVTGWSDVRSGLSTGATRMFVYATLDRPVTASGLLPQGNRPATGYVTLDTAATKTVNLRIATSLISVEQAKHNLDLEIAAGDTLESVRGRAEAAWNAKLRTVEVEGASHDQLVTLYSNLYRLFLYPNSGHENTGTAQAPVWKHAVQSSTTSAANPVIADGKVYVNNGFWDTYRTTWPAYALLTPTPAAEMVDGFVQQYRDGGWIARWSSPGYANLMVGTSSDVAFADAYLKGIDVDVEAAYAAAVKNASVRPPNANVGRKGFDTSPFKGWTPSDATGEAMSWAMDGYINDYGIANMAAALAAKGGPDAARYREEAAYYRNRATQYVNMFDPEAEFFQGRTAAGQWRVPAAQYDPRVWGHDYTETNGWNMAFHVPQDGQGLANLYGGRAGLEKKLDTFFATPETATFVGSYGGVIHEMLEARDVRMGQYGHSNQPSHHIPYMYTFAGSPAKTQATVREILDRLYLGSELGQGYAGDEDNGEMSAWYIFSALGFYPLQMGSPNYAIGSPLFTKATVNLENGKKIVVNARNNSPANVYVQSLTIDGTAHTSTSLPHATIADGATLDFTMGPKPSSWGTGANAAPPSLTTGSAPANPRRDIATTGAPAALVDDTSATRAAVTGPVALAVTGTPRRVEQYTLTSADTAGADPSAWKLEGSYDGATWATIDQRSAQAFPWRLQTRPFTIAKPGRYAHYRFTFTTDVNLAEVELLARPPAGCTTSISGDHRGSVTARSGSVCIAPGATVRGSVTVSGGASLVVTGATVTGAITATGASDVVVAGTTVSGPVTITGTTGTATVEASTVKGALTVVGNRGPLVAANAITGILTCAGNTPPPTDNDLPNTVRGLPIGQCSRL
ncbi:GH92 family glycosyl hydrolase [Spirilliplanes yamanashiensis]|uniref:Alpha-1 2-mannosidase n=1 Tax=Spirilliplanes yamanashiensis TaxID=42233 RepID=A0A8J4DIG0_9ACTN|nr:GH92 family glycosyl hydrolase [Spirilliplanes yamanashiensis]MDP9819256.1 putative alpha-1,2-mannosidase [Spirilliplanes yamanashiensis]GIJ01920.1 alpha-1 2-mannosidase [Spirilliplanes yamanashiensis]